MHKSHVDDQAEKITAVVAQHCRVKYAPLFSCIPHHSPEFTKQLSSALKDFVNNGSLEKSLTVAPVPYSSGAVVLPIEYVDWTTDKIVNHAAVRLTNLVEEIYVSHVDTLGDIYFAASFIEQSEFF